MKENLYVNSDTRIIARNNLRFLATNEKNITINDIASHVFIIDEDGNIENEDVIIGSIIKFGYWNMENTTFGMLKNKLYIYNNIVNSLLGMAVSEMLMIICNIFSNIDCSKMDLKKINSIFENYGFDVSGLFINMLISCVKLKEFDDDSYQESVNNFVNNISQLKKYNVQYQDVLNIVDKYSGVLDIDYNKINILLNLGIDYLFDKKLEKRRKIVEYNGVTETDKLSFIVCIDFMRNFLDLKDKREAFYSLSLDNYINIFSQDTIDKFKELFEFNFKDINVVYKNDEFTQVQNLIIIFNSILTNDNYLETVLSIQNSSVNNIVNTLVIGLISGFIYQENGIPEDMLINLNVEEQIRNVADTLTQKFYNIEDIHNKI